MGPRKDNSCLKPERAVPGRKPGIWQVNGIRSSAVVADADAICRARGRRPSVVEAGFCPEGRPVGLYPALSKRASFMAMNIQ